MNTWRMNGSQERAVSPSMPFTVGTVRQPRTCWPSACTTCSNFCSIWRRSVGLRGRKTMPLPYSPAGGSGMRAFLQTSSLKACGICMQHAGAVAGVDLAAAGAAVVEVLQDLDGLLEDAVRLAALDVDHEAEPAGVVLEARIVESLPGGALGTGSMGRAHRFRPACMSKGIAQGHAGASAVRSRWTPACVTESWKPLSYDMRACRRQCSAAKQPRACRVRSIGRDGWRKVLRGLYFRTLTAGGGRPATRGEKWKQVPREPWLGSGSDFSCCTWP